MDVVELGAPTIEIAQYYCISRSSFADHMEGRKKGRKYGPQAILSNKEEQALESYMLSMVEYGHFFTIEQLYLNVAFIT